MPTQNCGKCGNSFSYSDSLFSTSPRSAGLFGGYMCSICAAAEDSAELREREMAQREEIEKNREVGLQDGLERISRKLQDERDFYNDSLNQLIDERNKLIEEKNNLEKNFTFELEKREQRENEILLFVSSRKEGEEFSDWQIRQEQERKAEEAKKQRLEEEKRRREEAERERAAEEEARIKNQTRARNLVASAEYYFQVGDLILASALVDESLELDPDCLDLSKVADELRDLPARILADRLYKHKYERDPVLEQANKAEVLRKELLAVAQERKSLGTTETVQPLELGAGENAIVSRDEKSLLQPTSPKYGRLFVLIFGIGLLFFLMIFNFLLK